MPIYEYRCEDCEQLFEEWQSGFEEKALDCPMCGGRAGRIMSNTSFVLKGSGWYTTDYCKSEASGGNGASDNGSNGSTSKADAKSDSKPDAKAKPDTASKPAATDSGGAGTSDT